MMIAMSQTWRRRLKIRRPGTSGQVDSDKSRAAMVGVRMKQPMARERERNRCGVDTGPSLTLDSAS
jgi:hypothetical protein